MIDTYEKPAVFFSFFPIPLKVSPCWFLSCLLLGVVCSNGSWISKHLFAFIGRPLLVLVVEVAFSPESMGEIFIQISTILSPNGFCM
jgi:hypothetical protein